MSYLVPDIELNAPYILVTSTTSSINIYPRSKNSALLMFGLIEEVYDGCGAFAVGQKVLIPQEEAVQVIYGSTIFYLIAEDKIIFSEP